jgi:hypothetical protein
MNKQIKFALLALVAVASLALADSDSDVSAKDTKKIVQNNFLETEQRGIKLSGYVDAGYSYNFTGAANGTSDVTGRFCSDTAGKGDFNLYAVKLALEKAMSSENKAQAGFRTDVMIGEDANYLINRGQFTTNGSTQENDQQNSNALFLEQAYVSIRAPVGNGWDFKVGKFVSILGYEVIERPANMNVTYGLLWQQMPLYYTGVLSSYKFDDYLDAKLGVVNGSQTDNNTTTSGLGDGCAVLAALNVTAPGGNANWSNNFQYSSNNDNNTWQGLENSSTFSRTEESSSGTGYTFIYNSWGNWAPKFADDKLLFAFNALLGTAHINGDFNAVTTFPDTTWYGAGAYAKYQINDWFSLMSRGEYLGGNNTLKMYYANPSTTTGNSLWEYTLTAGFNVIDNLLIRAEYRLDWGTGSVNNFQTGRTSGSEVTVPGPAHYAGAEIVYSF